MDIVVPYKPRSFQKEVHNSKARYITLVAHRRFGKSIFMFNDIQRRALLKPGRYAIVCPEYKQARSIYWLGGIVGKYAVNAICKKKNESDLIIYYKNGSILQFIGSDNYEPHRGAQFDWLGMDEFSDHDPTGWQTVFRYTIIGQADGSFTGGGVTFTGTLKGENHLWQQYLLQGEDRASFLFPASKTKLLSEKDIQEIREECEGDESVMMQELECIPMHYAGLIFKDFGKNNIIKPFDVPFDWGFGYSLDHGANNPTAFYVYRIDTEGNVYIVNEYYKGKDIIANHAPWIKNMRQQPTVSIIADPSIFNKNLQSAMRSVAYSVVDEYEEHGIGNFTRANNDVLAGINRMAEYIRVDANRIHPITGQKGSPKLFIFEGCCPQLEKELRNYRWKEKKTDLNDADQPVKLNDHACLTGDTEIRMADGTTKQIRDITLKGEYVATPLGKQRVESHVLSRINAPIVSCLFSDGTILRGTKDHKVFTTRGIVSIDELRYSDSICVWNNKYSTVINTTGTVTTSRLLEAVKMGGKDFIKQYGFFIMGKFLQNITSTIKTTIGKIIIFLILSVYQLLNIVLTILEKIGSVWNFVKKYVKILIRSEILQKNGTHQKKEKNGTVNICEKYRKIDNELIKYVSGAVRYIRQYLIKEADFAIKIVKRLNSGNEDVYNLTVENEHCYYANGILVRNCDSVRYFLMSRTLAPDLTVNVHITNDEYAKQDREEFAKNGGSNSDEEARRLLDQWGRS